MRLHATVIEEHFEFVAFAMQLSDSLDHRSNSAGTLRSG